MWLLILLVIVFLITVFLLGSYAAKVKADAPCEAPYPTEDEKERNHKACTQLSTDKTATGTCGSNASKAADASDESERPCKKHRKYHCHVCKSDDGFSMNGIFGSSPAPF
jgi:hypothetical protein